jgi:hypothetical protein
VVVADVDHEIRLSRDRGRNHLRQRPRLGIVARLIGAVGSLQAAAAVADDDDALWRPLGDGQRMTAYRRVADGCRQRQVTSQHRERRRFRQLGHAQRGSQGFGAGAARTFIGRGAPSTSAMGQAEASVMTRATGTRPRRARQRRHESGRHSRSPEATTRLACTRQAARTLRLHSMPTVPALAAKLRCPTSVAPPVVCVIS